MHSIVVVLVVMILDEGLIAKLVVLVEGTIIYIYRIFSMSQVSMGGPGASIHVTGGHRRLQGRARAGRYWVI